MKKTILIPLLIVPVLLGADVIPAINSKDGAMVLPEGKLKMFLKHIWFKRDSMFDGKDELKNKENLDAKMNITMVDVRYGLSDTTSVAFILPYKQVKASATLGGNSVAIDNSGIGDVVVMAKYMILPMRDYGYQFSVDGAIKFPTGSTNKGFKKAPPFAAGINTPLPTQMGSGEFEYILGAGLSYMIDERWRVDTHAQYIYRPKAKNSYDFGNEINLDIGTVKAITNKINLGIEYNFKYNSTTDMGDDTNQQLRAVLPFKAFSGSAGYITPQIEYLPFGKPKIHFGVGVSFLTNYDLKEYQPLEKERFTIRMGYLF